MDCWKFARGDYITDGIRILIVRSLLQDTITSDYVYSVTDVYSTTGKPEYFAAEELELHFEIAP